MTTGSLRVLAGIAGAALFIAAIWIFVIAPKMNARAADGIGRGEYVLSTTEGTEFTQESLPGQVTAVFFGFTHCPDVCPTTLGDMMGWQERLGDEAQDLRILFVTVDPERDTLPMLSDYVSWLPGAIAATGTPDEVKKAEDAFRVFAQREPLEDGDYTMSHTSKVMLFDRDGEFADTISYQEDEDSAVAKIDALLQAS
ncbi:SCO family protein [Falsirhodobacter algicola]|uniref:SCO family protein n=1 Tax=Falsirhodobacter algicola TaxID=2692330 RepID=A0A8J8MT32_9RHOB|nr:SCO family protein [Falsirhodobacter algicola]QUS36182.1 SCO family protein [Falsirhodobacter algicola]